MNAPRAKKCKRPDGRPARARYWASGRLATRKIRRLMRSGYSLGAAIRLWESTRRRHYGASYDLRALERIDARL